MGFSFNPLLWFLCGSCKEAFPNIDDLKGHKLKQHLEDCIRIKCIVFEEKFVDDAWTPSNRNSSTPPSNDQCSPPKSNANQNFHDHLRRFQNPSVAVKRLHLASSRTSARKRKQTTAQRSGEHAQDSTPSKSQRSLPSPNETRETYPEPTSDILDPVHIPILILKEEPEEYNDAESSMLGETSSSPMNFRSPSHSIPTSNPGDPDDREFILSSVESGSDTTDVGFSPYSFALPTCHSTPKTHEDIRRFKFFPGNDAASLEELDPLAIPLTPDPLDSEPKGTSDAEVKRNSNNDFEPEPKPEPKEENESHSEFEPESDSGSEWERESDSDFEAETSKKPGDKPSTRRSRRRSINVKEKKSLPFPCSLCSKSFHLKTSLQNHRIVHQRSKPFRCSLQECGASYKTKYSLARHMTMHGEPPRIELDMDRDPAPDFEKKDTSTITRAIKEHPNQPSTDLSNDSDLRLDLPLLQWLLLQEEENPTDPILLDPDPKSCDEFQPVSKENPVKCKLCEKRFECELKLRRHVSNCFLVNKKSHRYCHGCDRRFCSPETFRKHVSIKHSTVPRPTFKCSVCSKEFKEKRNFEFHQASHERPKGLEDESNLGETQSQEKKQDKEKNEGNKSTFFRCLVCDKSFMLACLLKEHERIHTGECPFKCDFENCGKAFPKKGYLVLHRRSKHMEELGLPGHLCPICGKKYRDKNSLRQHMNHNHDESKLFKCTFDDTCSRLCKNKAQLTEHIRTVHTGEKPFQCDQCGDNFSRKRTLVRHIKQTHEGFRHEKVPCPLCPRLLPTKFKLKIHMKAHEGGKSFECKVCGYITSTLNYLSRHEKIHGEGAATENKQKSDSYSHDDNDVVSDN